MTRWRVVNDMEAVPEAPGCYVLGQAGLPLYIGQSVNLRDRLKEHGWKIQQGEVFTSWGSFRASIKIRIGLRFGEWLMLEARLIRRLRPSFNKNLFRQAPRCKPLMNLRNRPQPVLDDADGLAIFKQPLYSLRELSLLWELDEQFIRKSLGGLVVPAVSRDALSGLAIPNPDKRSTLRDPRFVYARLPEL